MKERDSHNEENLARLIRAGLPEDHRPGAAASRAAWEKMQAVWREHHAPDALTADAQESHPISAPPCMVRSQNGTYSRSRKENNKERTTLMRLLLSHRWGLGLGAAATAAVVIAIISIATPNAQARAVEVMTRGAQAIAKLTSVHLRGQLRTLPADNFSYINPDRDFHTIELWKKFEPELKWRVEKPGRVAVMDGQCTVMHIKTINEAVKFPGLSRSAFDTEWLHRIANLSNTISNELRRAQAQGWKLDLTEETVHGRAKAVVTVHAKSGLPDGDYVKNSFFDNADTRRVYRFDAQSERLESVQIYLRRAGGEVQIFELSQIDYDQPIDPTMWRLELPADVSWHREPQKLPDNERYSAMTPEAAARAFFEACSRQDWDEVGKFMSPVNDRLKDYLGGLQIVSLSQAFTSKAYPGRFVPYEIRLRPQEIHVRMSNSNTAHRYVLAGWYDRNMKPEEDYKWASEPEVLADNAAYAKLAPAEAARAAFAALAKLDWDEACRFMPAEIVDKFKGQLAAAEKQGINPQNILPLFEVGEAAWSESDSAWYVKCRVFPPVKKHNLAVRKDNPAGRWQVDGGI